MHYLEVGQKDLKIMRTVLEDKIFYYDVVSLYPTVNALDEYAVRFGRLVKICPGDILNGSFFGIAKVDITPPKNLYLPVLPDNSSNKLLFHLCELKEKTFTSLELKKALELGYVINKIYGALEYKRFAGLMREYVSVFIKMKIEHEGDKSPDECQKINEYHKKTGFYF